MANQGNQRVTRRSARWLVAMLLSFITLMAAACGSDAVETSVEGAQAVASEAEESEPVEGNPKPLPPDEPSEASPEDLIGTWEDPGGIIWQIGTDAIQITGGVANEASYSATSTTFEFSADVCGLDVVGTYGWKIVDDVMTLTLINDACDGRGDAFDGKPWARQESEPAPQADGTQASPEDLIGTWTAGPVTWEIEADVWFSEIPGGNIESTYSVTGNTYELTDFAGNRACAPNLVGKYEWEIVDDVLTVTVISDGCEGRAAEVDGLQLTRQ